MLKDDMLKQAIKLQTEIDANYNIDIAVFDRNELITLRNLILKFLNTGVETEKLKPAGDYTEDELTLKLDLKLV